MLDRLATGSASVSELARPLHISLAAVLQHVQILEASGLVKSRKSGRVRTCTINADALRSTEQWLTDRRTVWQRRLDRLGVVLDGQVPSERANPHTAPSTRNRGRRT